MFRFVATACLCFTFACAHTGPPQVTPIPSPPSASAGDTSGYVAHVSRGGARFVFPPLTERHFEWWSDDQRTQLTTYSWAVLVRGRADTAYRVGFWLPAVGLDIYARWYEERRPVPQGTQQGSLAELLAAGMHDVSRLESHVAIPVPGMVVRVTTYGQQVVIEVRGSRTVRHLFALRPSHVTFIAYRPGHPTQRAHVAVTYDER